jgi:hypothetical protein
LPIAFTCSYALTGKKNGMARSGSSRTIASHSAASLASNAAPFAGGLSRVCSSAPGSPPSGGSAAPAPASALALVLELAFVLPSALSAARAVATSGSGATAASTFATGGSPRHATTQKHQEEHAIHRPRIARSLPDFAPQAAIA